MRRYNVMSYALIALAIGGAPRAHALLGSFTASDGYYPQYNTILGEVSHYNAGANNVNAGGGPAAQIVGDSGLWKVVGPVGGVFTNPAFRAAYLSGGPGTYAATDANAQPAYILGGHFPGRTGDQANLALRNDTPIGTGAMKYDYSLDTYDFGGPAPATITAGTIDVQFYFCPDFPGAPNPSGTIDDKFTMSLKDSSGNIGMQWGYARDNVVYWRKNPSNSWNPTGFTADHTNWDGMKISVDLSTDTFALDYFDVSASTWTNVVGAGTSLGTPLTNLTTIGWQLEDGVAGGPYAGKNFFDDFTFNVPKVPEPASIVLTGLAFAGLALARKRGR